MQTTLKQQIEAIRTMRAVLKKNPAIQLINDKINFDQALNDAGATLSALSSTAKEFQDSFSWKQKDLAWEFFDLINKEDL